MVGADTFWTPIADIKDSRGVRFYVTAGGLDGMPESLPAYVRHR